MQKQKCNQLEKLDVLGKLIVDGLETKTQNRCWNKRNINICDLICMFWWWYHILNLFLHLRWCVLHNWWNLIWFWMTFAQKVTTKMLTCYWPRFLTSQWPQCMTCCVGVDKRKHFTTDYDNTVLKKGKKKKMLSANKTNIYHLKASAGISGFNFFKTNSNLNVHAKL